MTRKNRFRALRNLALAAVLLFAAWLIVGAPIPHQLRAANMRREERRCLLPRSEIVWRYRTDESHYYTLVGLAPTSVYTYITDLEVWARSPDGPTLVSLPMFLDYPEGQGGTRGLLAVEPPVGAESARLTLTLEIEYGPMREPTLYSEEYQEEGVRDGECFFFTLTRHHPYLEDPQWGPEHALFAEWGSKYDERGYFAAPYTLEFFDGDGKLILRCGNQT